MPKVAHTDVERNGFVPGMTNRRKTNNIKIDFCVCGKTPTSRQRVHPSTLLSLGRGENGFAVVLRENTECSISYQLCSN